LRGDHRRAYEGEMAMLAADSYEQPSPCVLDADDVDRLLERLRAVHGERDLRADIAPELRAGRQRNAKLSHKHSASEQGLLISG
jgi:hypothetical protein